MKASALVGFVVFLLFTEVAAQKKVAVKEESIKVVIDPGHGGIDPGTERRTPNFKDEKDLVLAIALKVEELINESYSNIKVIQTRNKDVTVSLEQRVAIANEAKGDYFVSIHCNSSEKKHISGTQMHVHDFTYRKSTKLAQILDEEFTTRAKRNSKGLFNSKDRRFNLYVLQYTNMPGVLIETGFLTHKQEEEFLNSDNGQEIIAAAIFRGIRNFLTQSGHKLTAKEKTEDKILAKKDPKNRESKNNTSLASYKDNTPPKLKNATDGKVVYKVQISASPKKISLNHAEFKKLDMKIEEAKATEKNGDTTYKYTVGNVYTIEDALELMEYIRKNGFKDAFITKFGR
ncbi:MAG: N-acetylmuramoyl-L-alanine amidase [Cytophagales bacterium]|nr:MAG: N-acetylmuramoyl-L-alanine amidase [Cytophagales bacterium]